MGQTTIDTARLRGESVLVTGGAGFIGSHLTDALVERGAAVTVLDDLSAGTEHNLSEVRDSITLVTGDVRDREVVKEIIEDQRFVFHLGANAHVPTSVERPQYDFEVNAGGTQIVLTEAHRADVERVVFASSAAVYGPPQRTPMAEDHPLEPVSPYGASKLAGEKLGMSYHRSYDVTFTALRIFNTFGPRQSRYVMYDFFKKLEVDPSQLEVLGSGEERRTFAYVTDTVEALLTLAVTDEAAGEVYNFGGPTEIRIIELAELLAERYYDGQPEVYTTDEPKPGDIRRLIPDNSKIESLGATPKIPLDDGLDELYAWFHREVATA